MKTTAQALGLFILLTLIKNSHGLFKLPDSQLSATEGSCIEIKCEVTGTVEDDGAYWFWMKDGYWDKSKKQYTATIVYSTNNSERPVDPDFISRVKYVGTSPSNWNLNTRSQKFCSILICDLKQTDSGRYAFRFRGKTTDLRWTTENVTLAVTENRCPLTFENPPVVKQFQTITLTCSTVRSCPTNLQIRREEPLSDYQQTNEVQNVATVTFTASWVDDGRKFSCQTKNNVDKHLIRHTSVTVEYLPRDTMAKISHTNRNIVEGQSVTLTCSAKGRPDPTFYWTKDGKNLSDMAEWKIQSIRDSQSGTYHCVARNKHGSTQSTVDIDVEYAPQTEVKMTSPASEVKQGDMMTLQCAVKRSNPQPHSYRWLKNGIYTDVQSYRYNKIMEPEDSGSYTCRATNTQGTGISEPLQIRVQYGPRRTYISIRKNHKKVKVDESRTLTCKAEANPAPVSFTWYRYTGTIQTASKQRQSTNQELRLERVQRADEACYTCKATNIISTGEESEPLCIQVLYPPTNLVLSMDTEVTEDQLATINCTVESFPPSHLKLTRTPALNPQSPEWNLSADDYQQPNTLQYTFRVNPTHTGFYSCDATNAEGSRKSAPGKLMVKYRPTDVRVEARPGLTVDENMMLMLRCIARSYPPVSSFTWIKTTDGKKEIIQRTQTINIKSVSPPDSGPYSCSASNEVGTGNSQQAEVKVKYAPKQPNITRGAEQQHLDGTRSVMLSCSSHGYPPLKSYLWYRRLKAEERDVNVSYEQNYTVHSNLPGVYYCAAENEINRTLSDPVQLFVDQGFLEAPKLFFLFLIPPLVIFLLVLVYRHKRSKAIQQGTANTPPCCAFLGRWSWNCASRWNPMNQPFAAEASRSRGDLLPEQPCCPKNQRRQPYRGSAPATNINTVYCTVNLPGGKQGPAAQKPIREQGGPTEDGSPLHTGNKQRKKEKAEENVVYAMVSKQRQLKKNGRKWPEDYETVDAARAAGAPEPVHCEMDTSEEEVELNYSQVIFTAKPGHQRGVWRDSSTSDEEETQYSNVKV